ncbi:MAG: aminoacetone oxidase family FAD-binding enzyme [Chlamydiae bacterium]|nr:3-dehydro-bile acid delta(4,6)-reductase [Chlamydiales bacterium]MCH9704239.1 aminoacetone oxidase family FAD-binding enzyme [Chlamydiota bacterium]
MKSVVIGGGAAGIFAAIHCKALLLERSNNLLTKVKISGGGRCNVTTSIQEPSALVQNYPRGYRELLGPFHHFGPKDTVEWFTSRNVALKTERDGRIFPRSNRSSTIIDCLMREARGLDIRLHQKIGAISKVGDHFEIEVNGEILCCERLILATGSSKQGYKWAQSLGHTIQPPVPSLFTFNAPTSPLKELSGIAVQDCHVSVGKFEQRGPVLITHFGFSGPAIIKLSAFAARYLHEKGYKERLTIRFGQPLPRRLRRMLDDELQHYQIEGKTTHKEEFVTCGGVTLKEIDFRTMESHICPGLHFAGEILDVDGITGGFNFQNAWTTGYLAGKACSC